MFQHQSRIGALRMKSSLQRWSRRDGRFIQGKRDSVLGRHVSLSVLSAETARLRALFSTWSWYQSQSVHASRKRESYTRSGVSWLAGRDRTVLIGR